MRTIGEIIRDTRQKKGLSIKQLESKTKIRSEFINSLEQNKWEQLPEFPVLQGFVKNIADSLEIDSKHAIAVLRRDYPPKSLRINPKPDIAKKFSWSPRATFITGIVIVVIIVIGYLGFQYYQFIQPPRLEVYRPEQSQEVFRRLLLVEGTTDSEATVSVNNQPAIVDENGNFSTEIEITAQTSLIEIRTISRSGKETVIRREILPMLNE